MLKPGWSINVDHATKTDLRVVIRKGQLLDFVSYIAMNILKGKSCLMPKKLRLRCHRTQSLPQDVGVPVT